MNAPDALSLAALVFFALGAVAAIAGFRYERLRGSAPQFVSVGLAVIFKTASIGVACAQGSSHFFNSVSEMSGLLAWSLGCSYLLALVVSAARSLGALILPLVVLFMGLSLTLSRHSVDPGFAPTSLFAFHILSAFLGYGLFLTACGASLLYLEQARLLKRKTFGVIFRDLPSLERLERLEICCSWMGLAVFTAALVSGAMLAHQAQRAFWLEPKVLAAQITWLVFCILVVGRAVRWLSGKTAAKFVLAGAALVLLTFALGHPFGRPSNTGVAAPEAAETLARQEVAP